MTHNRRHWLRHAVTVAAICFSSSSAAFSANNAATTQTHSPMNTKPKILPTVAYKSLHLPIQEFGVTVPVACWFPMGENGASSTIASDRTSDTTIRYSHRISVRRIGQLLAGWNFIPEFTTRNFELAPTVETIANGHNLPLPTKVPVVLLAHGYLGSRFDLSHLAEKLAQEGFLCLSPEYPESLSASYDSLPGVDRIVINKCLLDALTNEWNVQATSFGIVGHSLGCGTAIQTGDQTWARVCIAGFPRLQNGESIPGNVLFLSSMNDGAVSLQRFGGIKAIPQDYIILDEASLRDGLTSLPKRAALVFDREDAPNHISFLSQGVNDAMIDLLSPLLPIAQALGIPVLDFDRYQLSRDSVPTAEAYHPIVVAYLKQQMLSV